MILPPNRFQLWIAPAGNPSNIPAFSSLPTDPHVGWEDISEFWLITDSDIAITFGQADEGSRSDPTVITLILNNQDGRFSPRNPLSPFFPVLARNTPFILTWNDETFLRRLVSGFVTSWPPRWDRSGNKAWVPIEINGFLRRLEALDKPLRSALYRELVSRFNAGIGIVAYWPAEDGSDSNTIASAIPDVNPMVWDGEIDLAAFDGFVASAPVVSGLGPQTGIGGLTPRVIGQVPSHTATGEVSAHVMVFIDPDGFTVQRSLLELRTTGSAARWQIRYDPGTANGSWRTIVFDGDNNILLNNVFNANAAGGLNGRQFKASIDATQNGADVDFTFLLFFVDPTVIGLSSSGTIPGETIGRATQIGFGAGDDMGDSAFGHAVAGSSTAIFTDTVNVLLGWAGERAVDRLIRLHNEEDIPFTFASAISFEPRMGPQGLKTFLELIRECEDADGGILTEQINGFGMDYRGRSELFNQTPILELDVDAEDLAIEPEPTDDDQKLINAFEAIRINGSSSTALNQESIDQVGLYDGSGEFNVDTDDQLPGIAQWIVHLGSVDEMRFPAIDMQLANTPIHIDDLILLRSNPGSRVRVQHTIPQLIGNEIDVLVVGWSEIINHNVWSIRFNTVPASPWEVATFAPDFSETITLNPNPDVETNIDGWEPLNGTLAHSNAFAQSGEFSIELTPNTTSEAQVVQTIATASDVTPGKSYRLSAWIRLTNVPLDCGLLFTTFDADFDPTVNDFGPLTLQVPIDTWTLLSYTTTAPPGVVQGIMKVRFLGTLTAADVCYVDLATLEEPINESRFSPTDSSLTITIDDVDTIFDVDIVAGELWSIDAIDFPFDVEIGGEVMTVSSITGTLSPQTFTVTRSVNSVVKSHEAAALVELAKPAIFARGAQA